MFRPYQFVQRRDGDFRSFYNRLLQVAPTVVVCFDLEDALETGDPVRTTSLRAGERQALVQLLTSTPGLDLGRVLVRINVPGTPHYAADLEALAALPDGLHAVLLPKTETVTDVTQLLAALPELVRCWPPSAQPHQRQRRRSPAGRNAAVRRTAVTKKVATGQCKPIPIRSAPQTRPGSWRTPESGGLSSYFRPDLPVRSAAARPATRSASRLRLRAGAIAGSRAPGTPGRADCRTAR